MQRDEEMFWLTLGVRDDIPEVSYDEMRRKIESILRALKRKAKKERWTYTIYGTVSNVHASKGTSCRYHVHLLFWANPGWTVYKFIVARWPYASPCFKKGSSNMGIWEEHGIGSKERKEHIYDVDGLFRYIEDNHDMSTTARSIAHSYPTHGQRTTADMARWILKEKFEHLKNERLRTKSQSAFDGSRESAAGLQGVPDNARDIAM